MKKIAIEYNDIQLNCDVPKWYESRAKEILQNCYTQTIEESKAMDIKQLQDTKERIEFIITNLENQRHQLNKLSESSPFIMDAFINVNNAIIDLRKELNGNPR